MEKKVVKVTKKDYFEAIKSVIGGMETVGDYPVADVVAFIDKSIEQIDAKAAKAKEKAAETKAEGDALRAVVFEAVTETAQTADEITAVVAVNDAEVSRAKVIARLTQLVKSGVVVKDQITVDGRKVMGYSRA